jgi:Lysozyme like domain
MPKLQPYQVYALARWAGLPESRAIIATAIAGCESGYDTNAHNTVPPDDSYGLWQINMIGKLGPARRLSFGISSDGELLNPFVNARAMAQVSGRGLNFGPWTCYTSENYKDHLSEAQAASAQGGDWQNVIDHLKQGLPTPGIGSIAPGSPIDTARDLTTQSLSQISTAVKWLSTPHNWWRLAGVIAGAILIFISVVTLLQPVIKPAVKVATKGLV